MMKYISYMLLILLAPFALYSCAATPTQEEDTVIYGEEPEGPGIFSGETGEIIIFKEDKNSSITDSTASDDSGSQPNFSESDFEEFSAFKRWLNSKQTQDQNYQEFLQWLKYEEYKRRLNTTD